MSIIVENKDLGAIIKDNKLMGLGNDTINDLIATGEFQVLKLLLSHGNLSNDEIEAKYTSHISTSMILSNLQADRLIEPTGNMRWKPANNVIALLEEYQQKKIAVEKSQGVKKDELNKFEEITSKKLSYSKFANILKDTPIIPKLYQSTEELFEIPELELLVLIKNEQPITTDELEVLFTSESSISMILSNLVADKLIQEEEGYKWIISPEIDAQFDDSQLKSSEEFSADTSDMIRSSLADPTQVIEDKQLIKSLLDLDYFPGKAFNEIIETYEFKILYLINNNINISSAEMQDYLDEDVPLTMILSNLKIDDLITQQNDYSWSLSETLRRMMMKVKITSDEFRTEIASVQKLSAKLKKDELKPAEATVETIKEEIIAPKPETIVQEPVEVAAEPEKVEIIEEVIGDTPDPVVEEKPQPRETIVIAKSEVVFEKPSKPLSFNEYIQELLIKHRYLDKELSSKEELMNVPEYELLNLLRHSGPLSSVKIEELTENVGSVSLTLSNLGADRLIQQTEDNNWRLSDDLLKSLEPSKSSTPEKSEVIKVEEEEVSDESLQQFILTIAKIGYIHDPSLSLQELLKISNFEVIKIVRDNEPISLNRIKEIARSESPVLISRTILTLEADENISTNAEGLFGLSDKFKRLLIEDELKAEELLRQEEEQEKELEKIKMYEEEAVRLEGIAKILLDEGIIKSETDDIRELMTIPEFEILAIITKTGSASAEKIKAEAESVSPVLISRSISKLDANNIINLIDDEYELERSLKSKFRFI